MAFTTEANKKLTKERGLGARQCVDCGAVYYVGHVPKKCANVDCPSNKSLKGDRENWQYGAERE
jgi:hypothetical protein